MESFQPSAQRGENQGRAFLLSLNVVKELKKQRWESREAKEVSVHRQSDEEEMADQRYSIADLQRIPFKCSAACKFQLHVRK